MAGINREKLIPYLEAYKRYLDNQTHDENSRPLSNIEENYKKYHPNNFQENNKYPIYEYRNKDGKNSSVLHISVYKKNYNIVKILIDYIKLNYPDKLIQFINTKNDKGIYPIHYASFRGSIDIIKLLIENGADITKKNRKKFEYNSLLCTGEYAEFFNLFLSQI